MNKTLRILQLNVRKQREVQNSLMNDQELKNFGILALSEPYIRRIDGKIVTSPIKHPNWIRIIPSVQSEDWWVARSMLWIRKDLNANQIYIDSTDLTAATIQLPDRLLLVISVYTENHNTGTYLRTAQEIDKAIRETYIRANMPVDIILAGDFNHHDHLWGGEDVSIQRQGFSS